MASDDAPVTRATQAAVARGLDHEVRVIERARTAQEAAERIGIPPGQLLKTLVVRRADDDFLLVLVPGPAQIDWPKLRAYLGVSRLSMPDAEVAREVTGYERGTITPLDASRSWPVLADQSIAGSGVVSVGGGAHGVAIVADADALLAAVDARTTDLI
jgi:Cys-tRNA(Pro) deacylase